MTELLEKAFQEASKLDEQEQNELATWILEELKSEQRWQGLFEKSEDILSQLADEALAEFRAGKTQELDLNDL